MENLKFQLKAFYYKTQQYTAVLFKQNNPLIRVLRCYLILPNKKIIYKM